MPFFAALIAVAIAAAPAAAHLAAWHPSMYGFNWTQTHDWSSYDNRPVAPLIERPFSQWWMHGPDHIAMPPNPGDYLMLPAGGKFEVQLACDKSATDYWNTSGQADFRQGEWPCPGSTSDQFHTKNINDTMGCAFGIAYKSDITQVQPNDITIFTVNHTCPWYRHQWFDVPADLPPCDDCICTFNWFHSPDDGAQQMYQNGYKCKVLNDGPGKVMQTPQLARRCGEDPYLNRPADPSNCTGGVNGGAKLPMYWLQQEGNNMFEDYYHPPLYNELYGFHDGAQTDIFVKDGAAATATTTATSVGAAGGTMSVTATTSTSVATSASSATSDSASAGGAGTTTSTTMTSAATVQTDAPAGASLGLSIGLNIGGGADSVPTSMASVPSATSSSMGAARPAALADTSDAGCAVRSHKRNLSQKAKRRANRDQKKMKKRRPSGTSGKKTRKEGLKRHRQDQRRHATSH